MSVSSMHAACTWREGSGSHASETLDSKDVKRGSGMDMHKRTVLGDGSRVTLHVRCASSAGERSVGRWVGAVLRASAVARTVVRKGSWLSGDERCQQGQNSDKQLHRHGAHVAQRLLYMRYKCKSRSERESG